LPSFILPNSAFCIHHSAFIILKYPCPVRGKGVGASCARENPSLVTCIPPGDTAGCLGNPTGPGMGNS
jgi:hypothetical protein